MNIDRLREILDAYGSRPEHWPVAERKAVEEFLANSADAKILLAEHSALDSLLDALPAGDVPSSLTESVLASAAEIVGPAATAQSAQGSSEDSAGNWWKKLMQGSRGMLADIDAMQWSGPTFAKSAPVLGSAAVLGFLVAVYGPVETADSYLATSEDQMLVSAFSSPDFGMDDFSFDGFDQ